MNSDPLELDIVFLGSNALCREYSLMLEARGIEHHIALLDRSWALSVAPPDAARARNEITHYSTERSIARPRIKPIVPMPGAWVGGGLFAFILLLVAYAAGMHLFDVDWLDAGALSSGPARSQWGGPSRR